MAAMAASAAAAASSEEALFREAAFPEAHPQKADVKRTTPMTAMTDIILDI
jgi:hypothetical protein